MSDFTQAAEKWLTDTNGASLDVDVVQQHPAWLPLAEYFEEQCYLEELDAFEVAETLLAQITMGEDGELLWRGGNADDAAQDFEEWKETREFLHSVDYVECDQPESHPERWLYQTAIELLRGPTGELEAIRAMIRDHAVDDSRFTGELPPNVVPIRPQKTEKPKPKQPKPKHHEWLDALLEDDDEALDRVIDQKMVVNGMIPAESFGFVFGESGVGKSFVALDICHAVATGRPWMNNDDFAVEEPGVAVFVAAEGANGVRVRKKAIEQETGIPAPMLRILPAAPMMDGNDGHLLNCALAAYEERTGQRIALVVLDTLSQTMEGDQNAADATAGFIRGCKGVRDRGAAVMVVHHSGLADKDRMRGSTNLKAAGDWEFSVQKAGEGMVTFKQTKNKYDEALPAIPLKLRKVKIHGRQKRDGKPLTSLVVDGATMADQLNAARQLSANEQTLLDILLEQCDGHAISVDEARDAFCDAKPDTKRASARQAFQRARKSLVDRHMVVDENECLEPCTPPDE
ncbi:AAA family ATPase [uncultured Halomonas sp.]|uniref:AAA family ATPase n=1 Tax=uncultured Halomonas sp. TaxID=173971 RepID=UPI00262AB9D1|nr:AAA family ATPase [uncultured Halomonas sp.]